MLYNGRNKKKMKSLKSKKTASLFQREISKIILEEIKDPHIKNVTITDCDVTNDLSFAKVYFTVLDRDVTEEVKKALNKASNYIEVTLSKHIDIRKMPKISFHEDTSIEYGEKIDKKLEELAKKEA